MTIDSTDVTVDGVAQTISQPATIIDGRTYVPLRFVSEQMGASVHYDNPSKTVTINTGEYEPPNSSDEDFVGIANMVKGQDYKLAQIVRNYENYRGLLGLIAGMQNDTIEDTITVRYGDIGDSIGKDRVSTINQFGYIFEEKDLVGTEHSGYRPQYLYFFDEESNIIGHEAFGGEKEFLNGKKFLFIVVRDNNKALYNEAYKIAIARDREILIIDKLDVFE